MPELHSWPSPKRCCKNIYKENPQRCEMIKVFLCIVIIACTACSHSTNGNLIFKAEVVEIDIWSSVSGGYKTCSPWARRISSAAMRGSLMGVWRFSRRFCLLFALWAETAPGRWGISKSQREAKFGSWSNMGWCLWNLQEWTYKSVMKYVKFLFWAKERMESNSCFYSSKPVESSITSFKNGLIPSPSFNENSPIFSYLPPPK